MQHKDETAAEYLRRIASNLNYENESLLDVLPTVQAVIEYFELWSVYDTDFMQGILESIEEGADPVPLENFVKKWNLSWTIPKAGIY
jgi:hypothetical protein